jgi:hypothetical protein
MRLKGPHGDAAESLKRGRLSRIRAALTALRSVRGATLRSPWRGVKRVRRSKSLVRWALARQLMSARCSSLGFASRMC